jgi:IS30 family transposase
MAPIDDAIAAFESQEPGEQLSLTACAKKYNVERSTLGRRIRGRTSSNEVKSHEQRKLNLQQEQELCLYIKELTKQGLAPTQEMIRNYAAEMSKSRVSESWIKRFVHRNRDPLVVKWATGMDAVRHKADSKHKYELYFDPLHGKMEQYDVLPTNTYNMDEKGFLIGVTSCLKRVFTRR